MQKNARGGAGACRRRQGKKETQTFSVKLVNTWAACLAPPGLALGHLQSNDDCQYILPHHTVQAAIDFQREKQARLNKLVVEVTLPVQTVKCVQTDCSLPGDELNELLVISGGRLAQLEARLEVGAAARSCVCQ